MDAITLAIFVSVLTLGAYLLITFKNDYEQRRRTSQPTAKSQAQLPARQNGKRTSPLNSVQATKVTKQQQPQSGVDQQASKTNNVVKHQQAGKKLVTKKSKSQESAHAKNVQQQYESEVFVPDPAFGVGYVDPLEFEFEHLFFDSHHKMVNGGKSENQPKSQNPTSKPSSLSSKSAAGYNDSDYSAEKLFNVIASTSLSKDEIELAVETLLNKLDTTPGDSNWRRNKSDPLQKLKNQLRNSEQSLQTEVKHHEQTRAHLTELKTRLTSEQSEKLAINESMLKVNNENCILRASLDKAENELKKKDQMHKDLKAETSAFISKANSLEQDNMRLQTLLQNKTNQQGEGIGKLRNELDDKTNQLQCYELTNQDLTNRVKNLESNLRATESRLNQFQQNKQHDDYEAHSKISQLETDRRALETMLNDHATKLKEATETNSILESSVNELRLMGERKESLISHMREERQINDDSMERTLHEMEKELRELQDKLSAKSASNDEKLRQELSTFERELHDAGQRENALSNQVQRLREGLAELFPDLAQIKLKNGSSDEWIYDYLTALKQLAITVEELRTVSRGNNNNTEYSDFGATNDSPNKKSYLSGSSSRNGSSRVGSPTSTGRSSRAANHNDHDKRIMETKLVELNEQIETLQAIIDKLKDDQQSEIEELEEKYQQQLKDLIVQRNKFEAQIKYGLDSLRAEQERSRTLEEQLRKYAAPIPSDGDQ